MNAVTPALIQSHGSTAFRPIALDLVFFRAIHHPAHLGGRHRGPHIPLQVIPQALAAGGESGPRRRS